MSARKPDPEVLAGLIQDVEFVMLTTKRGEHLRSRPMAVLPHHYDKDLWFMTAFDSDVVDEIRADPHVNVAYSDEETEKFVSVCGTAETLHDPVKAREMWQPIAQVWFESADDPKLLMIRVRIDGVEYWNSPNGQVVAMFDMLKLLYTGNVADLGESRQLQLTDKQFTSGMRTARGTGSNPSL